MHELDRQKTLKPTATSWQYQGKEKEFTRQRREQERYDHLDCLGFEMEHQPHQLQNEQDYGADVHGGNVHGASQLR